MQAPSAGWQYFLTGLRAEIEERIGGLAQASPVRTIASSVGIGFLLGLALPKRMHVILMTPLIESAVERWVAAYGPHLQATASALMDALRTMAESETASSVSRAQD